MEIKQPQFNRMRPGSLYDRGKADSYYRRKRSPHWWYDSCCNVAVDLTAEEVAEYNQGYDDNEKNGFFEEYNI